MHGATGLTAADTCTDGQDARLISKTREEIFFSSPEEILFFSWIYDMGIMNVICRISSFLFFTSMFFVVHLVLANYVAPIARPSKGAREDTKIRGEERRADERERERESASQVARAHIQVQGGAEKT